MNETKLWANHLLPLVKEMVLQVDESSPGADWVEHRMSCCITQNFYGRAEDEWSDSLVEDVNVPQGGRLINEVPTSEQRQELLWFLTNHFPHQAHFRAHYGRYLYDNAPHEEEDENEAFECARTELDQAISVSQSRDPTLFHMRGMCARRQVRRLIDRYGVRRDSPYYARIVDLVGEASQFFEEARRLNPADEHSFVSEIQMLRDLVDRGTRATSDRLRILAEREDLRQWMETAFELLHRAERRLIVGRSPYFSRLRGDLERLQGAYERAIREYESVLQRLGSPAGAPELRRQISSLRHRWAIELLMSRDSQEQGIQQLRRARQELELVLRDRPSDERALETWFEVYTLLPEYSPETAQEYLDRLYRETKGGLGATFGLMCIWFIRAAQGAPLAYRRLAEFRRQMADVARRVPSLPYAKFWLGENWCLIPDRLVSRAQLESDQRDVRSLQRLDGYVYDYTGPTLGKLRVGEGEVELMFQPGRKPPDELRFTQIDAENRTAVTCVVYFAYDHPHAYDVKRKQKA